MITRNFLIPYLALQKTFRGNWIWKHIDEDWGSYRYQTFILLREDADINSLEKKISAQITAIRNVAEAEEEDGDEFENYDFVLQPLKNIRACCATKK
jgi:hypothetical protein